MRIGGCLLVLAACGRLDFDPPDRPSQLLVHYPMDDDPTTGTVTASEPGLDALCTACPSPVAGHLGGAYQFAAAQFITLPTFEFGSAPYSVALWIDPDMAPTTDGASIISKAYSDGTNYDVFNIVLVGTAAVLNYETYHGGTRFDYLPASRENVLGAWHHVAITWDGAVKRLYLDGWRLGSETDDAFDSTLQIHIGVDFDDGVPMFYFSGELDDVRLYTGVLTDDEVAELAAQ